MVIADPSGIERDVRDFSPSLFKQLVQQAARDATDKAALAREQAPLGAWAGPINWYSLNQVLHCYKAEGWTNHQRHTLRGLLAHSHWCQERLASHCPGLAGECQRCRKAPGTLFHRYFECEAWEGWRRDNASPRLKKWASRVARGPHHLRERFARALLPDAEACAPRRSVSHLAEFRQAGQNILGDVLSGDFVFTDGSCIQAELPRWRVAGWSVVVLNRDHSFRGALFGSVPFQQAPLQVARDGEDWAASQALRHLGGQYTMHVDCKATLQCLWFPWKASDPRNARAHMWDPVSGQDHRQGVMCKKVPAHSSWADVQAGHLTALEKVGNDLADKYAKRGASDVGQDESLCHFVHGCRQVAREVAIYVARMEAFIESQGPEARDHQGWEVLKPIDLGDLADDAGEAPQGGASSGGPVGPGAPSGLVAGAALVVAAAASQTPSRDGEQARSRSPGEGRVSSVWQVNGHQLLAGHFKAEGEARICLFCTKCWGYATSLTASRGLTGVCERRASSKTNQGPLNSGKHPRTKQPFERVGPPSSEVRELWGPRLEAGTLSRASASLSSASSQAAAPAVGAEEPFAACLAAHGFDSLAEAQAAGEAALAEAAERRAAAARAP